ncbi:hypothetical protein ACI8AC_17800 [Geodermatophilus sp. SYSU D00758]
MTRMRKGTPHRLRPGDVVEVRPEAEILATLGPDAAVDGLPFMPEMLSQCGSRFTVASRADTTCFYGSLLHMESAVHLAGVRCDGSAHGGCEAGCLVFWKEEWLRPVDRATDAPGVGATVALAEPVAREGCSREDVARAVHPPESPDGEELWSCQATQVRAATTRIKHWDLRHYVWDVRNGNIRARDAFRWIIPSLVNTYQSLSRTHLPRWLRLGGGVSVPPIQGTLTRTPSVDLGLAAGDRVRVKTRREIRRTLNRDGRNRGLAFDVEMTPYCGTSTRVQRVVHRIIDDWTGRMLKLPGRCLVLEGGVCRGLYHGLCQRQIEPYWHEVWLEREEVAASPEDRPAWTEDLPSRAGGGWDGGAAVRRRGEVADVRSAGRAPNPVDASSE